MQKVDRIAIQKEQARRLRAHGIGYKKIASITGLDRDAVRYVCKDIPADQEDGTAVDRMKSGEACLFCAAGIEQPLGPGRRRRFCCENCRREYWRLHRSQQAKKPEAIHIQTCAFCGHTFDVYGRVRRKYCCHEHYLLHRQGHKFDNSSGNLAG